MRDRVSTTLATKRQSVSSLSFNGTEHVTQFVEGLVWHPFYNLKPFYNSRQVPHRDNYWQLATKHFLSTLSLLSARSLISYDYQLPTLLFNTVVTVGSLHNPSLLKSNYNYQLATLLFTTVFTTLQYSM